MARSFDGSNDGIQIDTAAITSYPFTYSCWFYAANVTHDGCLMYIGHSSDSHWWSLEAAGLQGGDPLRFESRGNIGGADDSQTTTGFSANTWHHACAVATSSTDRAVFIDGGSKGTDTANNDNTATLNRTRMGSLGDATPSRFFNGRIAEAAIYSVALSDAEVALLATGVSPLLMRPQDIVSYWPLIRDDDQDRVGDNNLSVVDAPGVAEHMPKVIYPAPPFISYPSAVVANAMPMAMNYYRRRRVAA